ncbi:MAG: hypothetical protein ABH807_01900 [Candidatus Shapirobacteria bacterium]
MASSSEGKTRLRFVSSGTKVINQFMMFFVIGLAPIVFPKYIHVANRETILIITALALTTSIAYEFWRNHLEKKG